MKVFKWISNKTSMRRLQAGTLRSPLLARKLPFCKRHIRMMTSADSKARAIIRKVLDPKNSSAQVMDIYNEWATNYDEDMVQVNYDNYKVATRALISVVSDKSARVLDIGAGTGLLGAQLNKEGFTNIDALDPNENMLSEARKLNIYTNYIVGILDRNKLHIGKDTYDAVIGSGVFVPGHINEDCFEELCRITKQGGYVIIISSERYSDESYHGYGQRLLAAIDDLESRGLWKCMKKESLVIHSAHKALLFYNMVQ